LTSLANHSIKIISVLELILFQKEELIEAIPLKYPEGK
jgi:hypothetical protein